MIKLKIPVNNTVEIVLVDMYVSCDVRFLPVAPPQTTEAKIVLNTFQNQCRMMGYEIAAKITNELKQEMEKLNEGVDKSSACDPLGPLPEMPKKKRWFPEYDADLLKFPIVYFIDELGKIDCREFENGDFDRDRWAFLGVYNSAEEAIAMKDKIAALVTREIGEI